MKKFIFSNFLFLLVFIGIQSDALASALTTADEVYQKSVELNLLQINNGEVEFIGDLNDLVSDQQVQNAFNDKLNSINSLSKDGFLTIENNFELTLASPSEVEEIVYNTVYNNANTITPFAIDPGLPTINLKSLVQKNRATLEKFYYDVIKVGGSSSAVRSTIGYFVGKVKEGGSWDYKVQPGYRYWYKEWTAYTYSGTKVVNTEYIGNYNYGYVGEFVFNKATLLAGGGAVGVGVGSPEDAKDRNAITAGYNDAVKYE